MMTHLSNSLFGTVKRIGCVLTIVVFTSKVFAQHEFGAKATGGISSISTKLFQESYVPSTRSFFFMPSGQIGLFYNFHAGRQSIFGAELLFMQIEGKEHNVIPVMDLYGNKQFIIMDISNHISFLSLPVYYGYNFQKVNINIGIQASVPLAISGQGKASFEGDTSEVLIHREGLLKKYYEFGIRLGLTLPLNNKCSIETTYYHGFKKSGYYENMKQVCVGIRYKFIDK